MEEINNLKIEEVGHGLYKVFSGDNIYYVVEYNKGKFLCTCKGYLFNKKCKHIEAVKEMVGDSHE